MKSLDKMFWLLILLLIFTNTIGQTNVEVKMTSFATGLIFFGATREAHYDIDPGALPMGTYLVNIVIDGHKFSQKMVPGNL